MAYQLPEAYAVDFNASTGIPYELSTDFESEGAGEGSPLPIFLGPNRLVAVYAGSQPIQEIWYGSTKLWP